jgi:ethanolamine utilization protein EutQ (cupin superfamily)
LAIGWPALPASQRNGENYEGPEIQPRRCDLTKSPGQDADIFVGNLVDERHGGPITVGYGRYAPNQTLTETMAVDDVMIVIEGRLAVSTGAGTVTAGPGEIVYMPKGEAVTITTEGEWALTAYVTYPHWAEHHE